MLEIGPAVVASLHEARKMIVDVRADNALADDVLARELLARMADACARFEHAHPELNPNEWSIEKITTDAADDLFELRLEFAEVFLEMWDEWELASAQQLLNKIKLEEPDLSGLIGPPG